MTKRGLLIAGASHTGKSTLAGQIGAALGWDVVSTDSLSRHPGRPWPNPKPHVAAFYGHLPPDAIDTMVRHHHQNMWPQHKDFIRQSRNFVFEGSALRPELIKDCPDDVDIIVFYTQPTDLRVRILESAQVRNPMVDAFCGRALRENEAFRTSALHYELPMIEAENMTPFRDDYISSRQKRAT